MRFKTQTGPALTQRDYDKRYRLRKQAYVHSKKDVPCADCGQRYPHYVMDFDHVRGVKEFTIANSCQRQSFSRARIDAEIAKCEIVCSNCHRERTYQRKQKTASALPAARCEYSRQVWS